MELVGQNNNYRQLADEISAVLQTAAETAERMLEEGRVEATRLVEEAEAERRIACAEARRIVDEARMEADMVRAEAEWQSQEIVAQARRQAAERLAGADTRLVEVERAETRVLDRLAGVGQVLADALAALREGAADTAAAASAMTAEGPADDEPAESPTAKVYFVEFPPAATPEAAEPAAEDDDEEIVLTETPGASLFNDDGERSEWGPPASDLPAWWTRGSVQG